MCGELARKMLLICDDRGQFMYIIQRLIKIVAAASIFGLAACATGESQGGNEYFAETPPRDEIVCRRERPVGSHVPRQVCRTVRESDENQRRALEAMGPLRTMSGDLPAPPRPPSNSN